MPKKGLFRHRRLCQGAGSDRTGGAGRRSPGRRGADSHPGIPRVLSRQLLQRPTPRRGLSVLTTAWLGRRLPRPPHGAGSEKARDCLRRLQCGAPGDRPQKPGPNRGNAGFSDEERSKFSALLAAGFTDTFRDRNPGVTGAYSWWSYRFNARKNNAGWRIDYFLVSNRLRERVTDAPIYRDILGSDHCPVGLSIEV